MKKYQGEVQVLVMIQVKETPTVQSTAAEWSVGADTPGNGRRFSKRMAMAFVRDAVASWGGQAPPDYVFFPTNIKVTAKLVNKRRST